MLYPRIVILLVIPTGIRQFAFAFNEDVDFHLQEVKSLSELPLEKLIILKSTFKHDEYEEEGNLTVTDRTSLLSLPSALPLKREDKSPIRKYDKWEDEEKDSKISKIFHLTITTLSFLAFGGYLLSLIIMAIKNKTASLNTTTGTNYIFLSDLINIRKTKRPKRNVFILDPIDNDFDTDRIYRGMLMLSREYALYNR